MHRFGLLALCLLAPLTWAEPVVYQYRGVLGVGSGILQEYEGFPVEGSITVDSDLVDRFSRSYRTDFFSSASSQQPPHTNDVWEITLEIPLALPEEDYRFSTANNVRDPETAHHVLEIIDGSCSSEGVFFDRFMIYTQAGYTEGGVKFDMELSWGFDVDGINPGMGHGNLINAIPRGLAMDIPTSNRSDIEVYSETGQVIGRGIFRITEINFPGPPEFVERRLPCPPAPTVIYSSVLPSSRSVPINTPATAFATIVNASQEGLALCGLAIDDSIDASFTYQTTDPLTNEPTRQPDVHTNIYAGTSQSFVFSVTPLSPWAATEIPILADCSYGLESPAVIPGVNTLLLSATDEPEPDVIALATAPGGIVDIPHSSMIGALAVASINVGEPGDITVSADTGDTPLPLSFLMCQTDPASSECVNPPMPSEEPVTMPVAHNGTPTFAVFAVASGDVPFDPAANRVFVRFKDDTGATRGATSVAVRTVADDQ